MIIKSEHKIIFLLIILIVIYFLQNNHKEKFLIGEFKLKVKGEDKYLKLTDTGINAVFELGSVFSATGFLLDSTGKYLISQTTIGKSWDNKCIYYYNNINNSDQTKLTKNYSYSSSSTNCSSNPPNDSIVLTFDESTGYITWTTYDFNLNPLNRNTKIKDRYYLSSNTVSKYSGWNPTVLQFSTDKSKALVFEKV